ncbi:MAG: hypothetical protein HUU23_04580 [Caldilineales bacterium]|nr:hypothetical protein [Caldilineales bacterium]
MPPLTRRFIKTALVYLAGALVVALLLAGQGVLALPPVVASLTPVYFHLFMVGWVLQLIIGIVYWMFPKYSQAQPRRNEGIAEAVYWLLNAGLLLRVVGEPALLAEATRGWLLALSALLQWSAGVLFVYNTWPRVKER